MARYTPTDDEAAAAWTVATRRNSINGGQTNLPGGEKSEPDERQRQHYVACLAEIAVSRVTNLAWTGCGKGAHGLRDVGDIYEVRAVTDPARGLLVRTKDRDNPFPFVLVHVNTNDRSCSILGWAAANEVVENGRALDAETDKPCWILPPEKLRPFPITARANTASA